MAISLGTAVLLRNVACGAITGHDGDGRWVAFHGLTTNDVTDAITDAETGGLVERDDWMGGDVWPRRPYRLTKAGTAELHAFVEAYEQHWAGA